MPSMFCFARKSAKFVFEGDEVVAEDAEEDVEDGVEVSIFKHWQNSQKKLIIKMNGKVLCIY